MIRQEKRREDLRQVLVIHLRHVGYNEIESAVAADGCPNKLFQFKLHKGAANVQAVKVSSQRDATPRI